MRHPLILILALMMLFGIIPFAYAQEDTLCTQQIQEALAYTDRVCSRIGRNQVCYGNQLLNAIPVEDAPEFGFVNPGALRI